MQIHTYPTGQAFINDNRDALERGYQYPFLNAMDPAAIHVYEKIRYQKIARFLEYALVDRSQSL